MKKNKKQEKIRKILSKLDKEVIRISVQADLKNKNQSDLGKFVYNQLGIGAKVWFIENVKEWFWLHKEDGMIKLETGEEFY